MSPKSLLRHPLCVSPLEAFEDKPENSFYEYYDDPAVNEGNIKKVKRALFCTGKIYYDLLQYKNEHKREDVAIIRIEQLYPFPHKRYSGTKNFWVQEEPQNMGAWQFILYKYPKMAFELIARKPSASPATGFKKVHDEQQQDIVERAFNQ